MVGATPANRRTHATRRPSCFANRSGGRVVRSVGRLKALAFLLNGGNDGESYRNRRGLFQEPK